MSVTTQIIGVALLVVAVVAVALFFQGIDSRITTEEPENDGKRSTR